MDLFPFLFMLFPWCSWASVSNSVKWKSLPLMWLLGEIKSFQWMNKVPGSVYGQCRGPNRWQIKIMKDFRYHNLVVMKLCNEKICLFPTCDRYPFRNLESIAVGSNTWIYFYFIYLNLRALEIIWKILNNFINIDQI